MVPLNMLLWLTMLLCLSQLGRASLFSSTERVIKVFDSYNQISKSLSELSKQHNVTNPVLEEMLKEFKKITTFAKIAGNKTFVSNPINVFFLVKSITIDLEDMMSPTFLRSIKLPEPLVKNLSADIELVSKKFESDLPTKKDMFDAVSAVNRLFDYYQFDVESFAQGKFSADNKLSKPFRQMNYSDCYQMALFSYNLQKHHYAYLWANHSLKIYDRYNPEQFEPKAPHIFRIQAYKLLTKIAFQIDNKMAVVDYLTKLNQLDWGIEMFQWTDSIFKKISKTGSPVDPKQNPEIDGKRPEKEVDAKQIEFEKLCREESRLSKLNCRYKNDRPYLLVGPLKEETISTNPLILVHYDVISSSQAKILRGLAVTDINKGVIDETNPTFESVKIQESGKDLLRGLEKMIAIPGKNGVWTALNFGPAGYIWPPVEASVYADHNKSPKNFIQLYTEKIEMGGDVAFPGLKKKFRPQEKSSLLIQITNNTPIAVAHCPVAIGSKWAFTFAD